MEYRKEREFIVAYDGEVCRGKLNILTGAYIGIKGNEIKSRPAAFGRSVITESRNNNDLATTLLFLIDYGAHSHYKDSYYEIANRIEQVLSVGLKISDRLAWETRHILATDKTRLTKECVDFIKENYDGFYNESSISAYSVHKRYKDLMQKVTEQKEWAFGVLQFVNEQPESSKIPQSFIEGMILRAIHEKIFQTYHSGNFGDLICNWYNMITFLQDKLEVKHNILTNYTILKWIYQEYKNARYDELLRRNNDCDWLYYENDQFIVRPLLNRAEFHAEAEAQRNCVEHMYMERVRDGKTHVVTVRRKDSPNTSFITCEVDNDHNIRQYLYRYNRQLELNTPEANFYSEYRDFLLSSLLR